MNALVCWVYSRYPGLPSLSVFSSKPTPDTRTKRKVRIAGLKTVHAPPAAAVMR